MAETTNTFSLTKFKSNLTAGARPSLFDFNIYSLTHGGGHGEGTIDLHCHVSALPPLTVTPIEKIYKGRTVKIPGDMVFGDLTTTVFQTEAGEERIGIEKWMDQINSHAGNSSKTVAWPSASADLTQFDRKGNFLMVVTFVDIWPQSISEIALSYDTASDIEQYDVTWSYQYYTTSGGTPTDLSAQN